MTFIENWGGNSRALAGEHEYQRRGECCGQQMETIELCIDGFNDSDCKTTDALHCKICGYIEGDIHE